MFKSLYLRHFSKKTEKYGNFYINKDNNSEYENHSASSKKIKFVQITNWDEFQERSTK